MKNKKIKRKLKELKTFLLALNAYGSLDQETHVMIRTHIDGLFHESLKRRKK